MYHGDEVSMFTFHGNLRSKHSQFREFKFPIFTDHENSKHLIPFGYILQYNSKGFRKVEIISIAAEGT